MKLITLYAQDFNNRLEGMTLEEKQSHIERKIEEIKEKWAFNLGSDNEHMALVSRDLQEMKEDNIQQRWIAAAQKVRSMQPY